jgi:hypothetical protein
MLVVSIDIWPYGQKNIQRSLAKMAIANVGTSVSLNPEDHDYVWAYYEPKPLYGAMVLKNGIVRKHDRTKPLSTLVETCMKSVDENPEILSSKENIIAKKMKDLLEKLLNDTDK